MEGTRLRGVGGLCRIRFTLDRIKASPEATGRALQAMRWRSHARDYSAPSGACGRECDPRSLILAHARIMKTESGRFREVTFEAIPCGWAWVICRTCLNLLYHPSRSTSFASCFVA